MTDMAHVRNLGFGCLLLTIGYLWGATSGPEVGLNAQDTVGGISEDTANKIRAAHRALREAMEALQAEGRYQTVTEGINTFLVTSGGGDARADLESGRGVDPETFAALYAGQASPEVQDLLGRDEQGRVTYNNEVVRMYSQARLQRLYAERLKLSEFNF